MARCGYCNATILFGGRTVGGVQFCSTHHALLGRSLVASGTEGDLAGFRETLRELREDILALAEEAQQQRAMLSETNERLDFLERALVQLRGSAPPAPRSTPQE